MTTTISRADAAVRRVPKVPTATPQFWIAKLATTAFGEAFSDYVFFNDKLGKHKAILAGLALLAICLAAQFATRRYTPVVYWLTVTSVSIFGTMSADYLNQDLGLPLWASTSMLLTLQAIVFITWYATQRTLNVHSVDRPSREAFYWLTVIFTFALGTAAGDFVATTLGLGTLAATFVFLGIIIVPAVSYRWLGVSGVITFWSAYTITRPLGASFADWLGVPAPYGDGLQLGTGPMSLMFGLVLAAVVCVIAVRHRTTSSPRCLGKSGEARSISGI